MVQLIHLHVCIIQSSFLSKKPCLSCTYLGEVVVMNQTQNKSQVKVNLCKFVTLSSGVACCVVRTHKQEREPM